MLQQNILSEIFTYSESITWTAEGRRNQAVFTITTQLALNRLNQPGAVIPLIPLIKHFNMANENTQMGPLRHQ